MSRRHTAASQGLAVCEVCGQLASLEQHEHCPRCQAPLHLRKPDSLFDYRFDDFELTGYDPYPVIPAPVAV